jgi:hypothetical protein
MKLGKIFNIILNEAKNSPKLEDLYAPLTIDNGNVKLWHYSKMLIEDDFISTRGKQGLHSRSEFQSWGRSRSFFYGTEDGRSNDKGVPNNFKYICHMPIDSMYPVMLNPNDYKSKEGVNHWESMYEQASADGYKAFIYNLSAKKGVPIIVSFVSVPIDEKYALSKGGIYTDIDDVATDFPIGKYTDSDGEKWTVMQRIGYSKTLLNTYLTQETDPMDAMDSYQKQLPIHKWKDVEFASEHKPLYVKDIKKS